MFILFRRLAGHLFIAFTGLCGLSACMEGDLDIGTSIVPNVPLSIHMIDTVTVKASTIVVDSTTTANTGLLLSGRLADSRFGAVQAKAFFQLANSNGSFSLQGVTSTIRYDSLVLHLGYASIYGDTTQVSHLSVHQLSRLPDEYVTYYNRSSIPYLANPLGSLEFRPKPGHDSTLTIRLSDNLGQSLFQQLRDARITTATGLSEFLKGLVLVPSSLDNAAILSFRASTSYLRLYYHDNDISRTAYTYDLQAITGNTQFNQLINDRSGTLWTTLTNSRQSLSSQLTKEETLLHLGIGLRTKIEFPFLKELKSIPGFSGINRIELVLNPVRKNNLDNMPPPATLLLQQVNTNNEYIGAVTDDYGNQVNASYAVDYFSPIFKNQYLFSLTKFGNDIISNASSNRALLLNVAQDNGSAVNRLVLGSPTHSEHKMLVRIYYTSTIN